MYTLLIYTQYERYMYYNIYELNDSMLTIQLFTMKQNEEKKQQINFTSGYHVTKLK